MNKLFLLISSLFAIAIPAFSNTSSRILINDDWLFALGPHPDAYQADYDDSDWRRLQLPHDWSVEPEAAAALGDNVGPFTPHAIGGMQTGRTTGGEGWYRRILPLTQEDLENRVALYFEGIYNQSEVWVNGQRLCANNYGYRPFKHEITSLCKPGDNVIAVRALNQGNNTRWYAGSGIYRNVWLERTPNSYLDPWSTQIKTFGNKASIYSEPCGEGIEGAYVAFDIVDPEGKIVASARNGESIEAENAKMWHPDSPTLYTAIVKLLGPAGDVIDQIGIEFGFRDIEISPERGFMINGAPILLRGGCVHHDLGLLGAAAWNGAEARKISLLKSQGYNAIRCSHNLQSDNFLNECDRQGMIVIDECFDQWQKYEGKNVDDYHNHFDSEGLHDIEVMVRRDRNHPSVCFWSLGNEIPERAEPCGIATAKNLKDKVLSLDNTRPITAAIATWGNGPNDWEHDVQAAFRHLDVGGYNYAYDKYQSDHSKYPHRIMMGTESYPMLMARNWSLVESEPYVIGDFIWTAMDYVGEAGIGHAVGEDVPNNFEMPWPWFNGFCGDIDLIGQKKPQSHCHDVVWGIKPIAMLVEPATSNKQVSQWGWTDEYCSWTFPGLEGQDMTVHVYTRSPQVRLYLNGTLIGTAYTNEDIRASFTVPYAPGTLVAVEWDGKQEGAFASLSTTSEPYAIRLVPESWGELMFITAELIDSEGRVVESHGRSYGSNWEHNEGLRVSFTVNGAQLLAAGNASPSDQESFRSDSPRLWQGRALAIVRGSSPFAITAKADGLPETTLIFP